MKRELALELLWKFVGLPYLWGGSTPISGFDCSGLVIEILQSVGILKHRSDYSASGLLDLFKAKAVTSPTPGCLVFWGKPITHVEMVYKLIPEPLTIGASGGDSRTVSKDDAVHQQAFVKLRPLRAGYTHLVDPFL